MASEPNKMLGLTRREKEAPGEKITLNLAALVKSIRRRWGEFEYWGVVAPQQSGRPHSHLVVRSGFVPVAWLRSHAWACGWGRTHLQALRSDWSAANYCARHLAGYEPGRKRLRYSQGFFPPEVSAEMHRSDPGWVIIKLPETEARQVVEILGVQQGWSLSSAAWLESGLLVSQSCQSAT